MNKRYLTIKGLNKFCEINTEYNWYNEYEDSYLLRRNLDVIANHMLSIQIERTPILCNNIKEYPITILELEDGWKRRRERSILIGIDDIRDMNRFYKRLEEEVNKLLHL